MYRHDDGAAATAAPRPATCGGTFEGKERNVPTLKARIDDRLKDKRPKAVLDFGVVQGRTIDTGCKVDVQIHLNRLQVVGPLRNTAPLLVLLSHLQHIVENEDDEFTFVLAARYEPSAAVEGEWALHSERGAGQKRVGSLKKGGGDRSIGGGGENRSPAGFDARHRLHGIVAERQGGIKEPSVLGTLCGGGRPLPGDTDEMGTAAVDAGQLGCVRRGGGRGGGRGGE